MDTREKLEEVRDILAALLNDKRCPATIVRAHHLVESALSGFFTSEDDVATLPFWFEDETPFPAA